ncbi:MAG: SDR family NAD(P)-dependent oxidoreductase [Anaerolineae bacterium]|nr:SDR family NAD(P)-dependent oxidoreductase [Anaerolineae bacterium]
MKRWAWIFGMAAGGWAIQRALSRPSVPLHDKVVVITGASAGIGLAAAHAFAAQGARLVLVARNAERLEAARAALAPHAVDTLAVPADVSDPAAADRILAATLERFGRIDVLVNNAGLALGGLTWENDPDRIRAAADVDLYGTIRLTQAALPVMLRQGRGHIVNVSSMIGRIPTPGMAVYSGVKAGIVGFSAALRREVDNHGLRVTVVLPGPTETHSDVDLVPPGMPPGVPPEVPAQAIVDAVRYGHREVIPGGPAMTAAVWLERLAPWAADLYWKWIFTPDYIATVSRIGE